MSWKRSHRLARRAIIRCSALLVASSCLVASHAAAQTEESQSEESLPDVASTGSTPLEPPVRAAATAARRALETALRDENGNIRWAALRASRGLSSPWVAEIVLPLCTSPNIIERVIALEVVANTDPGVGRSAFLGALSSGERSVRLRGVLGLAALGDEDTVPHLTKILKDDPDPDLRAAAARALAAIADPMAAMPLYEAIESPYPPVREQAVLSLLAIGETSVGDYLLELLREDRDPGEAEILRLVALVPDPDVVEFLAPFLERQDSEIRTLAAAAITSIVERSRPRRR